MGLLDEFKEQEIYSELHELFKVFLDGNVLDHEPIFQTFEELFRKSTLPKS